jgi:hypothetical protein
VLMDASLLDREQSNEHRLLVTAYDSGQPPRMGQLDVTVIVLDANDNMPVFEYNAYEVSNGFGVAAPRSTDASSRLATMKGDDEQLTTRLIVHSRPLAHNLYFYSTFGITV